MCTVILTTVVRNNTGPINIDMLDQKQKTKKPKKKTNKFNRI